MLSINKVRFFISVYIALLGSGLWTTIFGSILKEISEDFVLSIDKMAMLFPLVSLGFFIGIVVNIIFYNKIDIRKYLIFFLILFPVFLLIIFLSNSVYLTFFSVIGFGICSGFLQITLVVLMSNIVKKNKGFYINLSYFFVSIGCLLGVVSGPYIVNLELSWRYTFLIASIVFFINFFVFLKVRIPEYGKFYYRKQFKIALTSIKKNKIIILSIIILSFFILTPMYASISSWIPNFLRLNKNINIIFSANILALFWLSIAMGRFFVGYITKRINIFLISVLFGFLFILTFSFIIFANSNISMVFFALSGFFIAGLYPNLITISMEYFPKIKKILVPFFALIGMFGNIVFNSVFVYFASVQRLNYVIYSLIFMGLILFIFLILIFVIHRLNEPHNLDNFKTYYDEKEGKEKGF